MKKLWILLAIGMVLCGCSAEAALETVADEMVQQVMAEPREVLLTLPEEAVLPAMESENGVLYICRDFDVSVQTMEGGDFSKTLQTISGHTPEEITVVQTICGDCTRFDFVWTSAGELGEQICRGCIFDDGTYHYSVTAMTDADLYEEYREIWNGMFETLGLC